MNDNPKPEAAKPDGSSALAQAPCSAFCRCCTCGYQWQRGKDGSHSCSESLLKILNSVRRVATGEDQVANDDTGGLAWIADYISAMLGDTPNERSSATGAVTQGGAERKPEE